MKLDSWTQLLKILAAQNEHPRNVSIIPEFDWNRSWFTFKIDHLINNMINKMLCTINHIIS